MNTYIKPVAEKISFTYENQVVAQSTCYTVTANIHQTPETGRETYKIQVDAVHNATHSCDTQVLYLAFNQPVEWVSSQGSVIVGSGNIIQIKYTYHNNGKDNIGLGDVEVRAGEGLAVNGAWINDIPNT